MMGGLALFSGSTNACERAHSRQDAPAPEGKNERETTPTTHPLDEAQVIVVLLLALHELKHLVLVRDSSLVEPIEDRARDARGPVLGLGGHRGRGRRRGGGGAGG